MFAKRWQQNKEISLSFNEKINLKQKTENNKTIGAFREKTFGLSWFMEPAMENSLNEGNFRKKLRGNAGEAMVAQALWFWLPASCNLFNNVVLKPVGDMFIQMDHLVISRKGIFIIETKNWKGFVEGNEEVWRKTTRWKGLEIMKNNPYKEQRFHEKMFKLWSKHNLREYYARIENHVFPLIIFEGCEGLRVRGSMPVYKGMRGAISYILGITKPNLFTAEEVAEICRRIQVAK